MNKRNFRVVFNQCSRAWTAVSEIAGTRGQGAAVSSSTPGNRIAPSSRLHLMQRQLTRLAVAVAALCGGMTAAHGQIVAYRNAPGHERPTVLQAGNGVPLINIQTPSAQGVSRNVYSQFNIDDKGAILNNSRVNTATRLGGWVQANPWLGLGTARIIVNEVRSPDPSELRGYLEVAGDRAHVIVANPSGLMIDGGGFINASRATLTTGTPDIVHGQLDAYRVAGGTITIDGRGLDTQTASYTDIMARAVQVNAALWANDLKVSTGVNTISADHGSVTRNDTAAGAAPRYAIDTGQLAGMYSGKITLVGTEHGVGMHNAGAIGAGAGEVVVTVDGLLTNKGSITAAQQLEIAAAGLRNQGRVQAVDNATLALGTHTLDNHQGLIRSGGTVTIGAGAVINTDTVGSDDQGIEGRTIAVTAGRLDNRQGAIRADSRLSVTSGGQIDNSGGVLRANDALTLNAAQLINRHTQAIDSQGKSAQGIEGQTVNINAGAIDNRDGSVRADTHMAVIGGTLDNTGGLIHANDALAITGDTVINTATHGTGSAGHDRGIQGKTVDVVVSNLDNHDGILRADTRLSLTATGAVDNTNGQIAAGGQLDIRDTQAARSTGAMTLTNTNGLLAAGKQLRIDSAAIDGDGKILSQGDLSLKLGGDFVHTGTIAADGNATLVTAGTLVNHGKMTSGKTLTVAAASINNAADGEIIADTNLLQATGSDAAAADVTNRGLIDGSKTFIDSATLLNTGTGRIYGDHVALFADTLTNTAETIDGVTSAAVIAARTRLDLAAANIVNSEHGLIYSAGDLFTGLTLDAAHQATGTGATLTNSSATIAADGNATISHQSVNNLNAHLKTDIETLTGERIVQHRPNGATGKWDDSDVRLVNKDSGQIVTDWRQMGDEDNFRLVLPSATYPFDRYGAAFYQVAYTPAWSTPPSNGNEAIYSYPEVHAYQPTDSVWQIMGVAPPESDKLVGPAPKPPGGMLCDVQGNCNYAPGTDAEMLAWQAAYDVWKPAYDKQQTRFQALDQAIAAFNADLRNRMVSEWTIYDGTEKIERTRVLASDPAMIQAGGNLQFNSQTVSNANSQIVAGGHTSGDLILGTRPVNTGEPGKQVVTTTGSALYTFIKSSSTRPDERRYQSAPYESQSVQTSFALDITPTGESGPRQDHTLKSVPQRIPDHTATSGHGNSAAGDMVVRTSNPDIRLPDNALFRPGNDRYLIVTDPRFTNYRQWLSSDYMLTQLRQDPALTLKRIGDGFYEQQLVQQQIQKAIGQRYIGQFSSNEEQFKALMTAGVQMAETFHYQLGVALSAGQMALLTSDIVWLVRQTVTLADGSTQEVLVPQVYLRANRLQVTGEGTLIAGDNVRFQTAADILNSGTIAAKNTTVLAGNNIDNLGGRITGTDTLLAAAADINNLGGVIDAGNSVAMTAARDIRINSTTVATANGTTTGTNIDSVAGVTGQTVNLTAGRDLTANAAVIDATGDVTLSAVRDLRLGTVNQHYNEQIQWADDQGGSTWLGVLTGPNLVDQANGAYGTREAGVNRSTLSASQDAVTRINGGNILLHAGHDLQTQGTQVVAADALTAVAGNNLHIGTANASASVRDQHSHTSSGLLSSTTAQTDDAASDSNQLGSTFSGNTTVLAAGNDAHIIGSDIVSTAGTQITAVHDLHLDAATDTSNETHYRKETTSGVFGGGGGLTIGSKSQSSTETRSTTTETGSLVGATDGDVVLAAGNHYQQLASTVIAPQGDIRISGQRVDILAGNHTEQNTLETEFRQQGVTVQISNPVLSAMQSMSSQQEAKDKTKNSRAQVLADAATILTAANTAAQIAGSPAAAGGVDVAISLGTSSQQSKTEQRGTSTAGSTVAAGGSTIITATGAGRDSNLTIHGSEVSGTDVTLHADNQIKLTANRNTNEEHSTSHGSAASIGVSMGSSGFMVNASASGSRGKGDGSDSSYTNTHVTADQKLTLSSGGDTTLQGATAAGKQVTADIGGNLQIESLQDTSDYHSRQESLGGSISVGMGKISGSLQAGQSKVDGNYQSVIEQSGILAGDDGFTVNVHGHTDLKGGKIASTDAAVDAGKNSFTTGSLTLSDIENKSDYQAHSVSVSIGGDHNGTQAAMNGTGIGYGSESGSEASVTKAGISGLAGDTTVRSDQDSSHALIKNWDGKELQQDVEAQAKIMESFGKQAALSIGTYATMKLNDLKDKIRREDDPAKRAQLQSEATNWEEGGAYRTALHAAAGALGGGLAGAAGATASSVAMPLIAEQIDKMDAPEAVKQALAQVAAAALGTAVGGSAGLASSVNVEANNRQLHQSEYDFAKKNAKLVAKKLNITEQEAEARIVAEILKNSDNQTAEATSGKHDYEIRSIVGCQNLNCDGYKNDVQYANHDFNSEYIKPNQLAYDAGQKELGTGQTYNELVTSNIKKDPVGASVAGVGMIGLGVVTAGGLPSILGMTTGGVIGASVNASAQYVFNNGKINLTNVGIAGATSALTFGTSLIPNLLMNVGGALAGSAGTEQNPNLNMAGAAVGTFIGFYGGGKLESALNNSMNPWYRPIWQDVGLGISQYIPPSVLPSVGGSTVGTIGSEGTSEAVNKFLNHHTKN